MRQRSDSSLRLSPVSPGETGELSALAASSLILCPILLVQIGFKMKDPKILTHSGLSTKCKSSVNKQKIYWLKFKPALTIKK